MTIKKKYFLYLTLLLFSTFHLFAQRSKSVELGLLKNFAQLMEERSENFNKCKIGIQMQYKQQLFRNWNWQIQLQWQRMQNQQYRSTFTKRSYYYLQPFNQFTAKIGFDCTWNLYPRFVADFGVYGGSSTAAKLYKYKIKTIPERIGYNETGTLPRIMRGYHFVEPTIAMRLRLKSNKRVWLKGKFNVTLPFASSFIGVNKSKNNLPVIGSVWPFVGMSYGVVYYLNGER